MCCRCGGGRWKDGWCGRASFGLRSRSGWCWRRGIRRSGIAMPVDVVPFVAPDALEYPAAEDGLVVLPGAGARHPELFAMEAGADPLPALSVHAESAKELVRPALCVQARGGRLHVFFAVCAGDGGLPGPGGGSGGDVPVYRDGGLGGGVPGAVRSAAGELWADAGPRCAGGEPAADERWDALETVNRVLHEEAVEASADRGQVRV